MVTLGLCEAVYQAVGSTVPWTPWQFAPQGLLGQHLTVTHYVLGVVIFNSFLIYLKT